MFSGIVEEVGVVSQVVGGADGKRFRIDAQLIPSDMKLGDSISVSGTCLTVVDFQTGWFDVEAVFETLRCTSLGALEEGSKVNLERALKVSDRLGGHLVTGHVDTVARVSKIVKDGFSNIVTFALDAVWSPFFVKKGSVTVDGVSLTVADLSGITENSSGGESSGEFEFCVALIPHTMEVTTLGSVEVGSKVNIETDVIARYVVRLLGDGYLENLNKERGSLLFTSNEG